MNWSDYIVSDKDVLLGKPTVKGTRISVDHVISLLAQGWTEEKILANYPGLVKKASKQYFHISMNACRMVCLILFNLPVSFKLAGILPGVKNPKHQNLSLQNFINDQVIAPCYVAILLIFSWNKPTFGVE